MNSKLCRCCNTDKPLSEYYANYTICKPCKNEQSKQWNKNNVDKVKITRRKVSLKKKYGITVDEYNLKLEAQQHKCAVCGGVDNNKSLAVDHCHKTGKIRDLLCMSCNLVLGKVNDSPELLIKLANYLTKHKES
jgi:hypothetical protein